jgi:hypothetical protein
MYSIKEKIVNFRKRKVVPVFLTLAAKKEEQLQDLVGRLLQGTGCYLMLMIVLLLCVLPAFYAKQIAKNNPDDLNYHWGKGWTYLSRYIYFWVIFLEDMIYYI